MSLAEPYYQADGITLYCGDCRAILPAIEPSSVALVLADPPYGVNEPTDRASRQRAALTRCYDFPAVAGDDEPFDPSHLLVFPRLLLFGANHYAERLPPSPSWVVWDKRDGMAPNDNADCELAWTNLGGPARVFRHLWNGMIKASERDRRRVHPTQKPIALFEWIIERHTAADGLVLDPYAGSGPVLAAAKKLGRRAIGIELSEDYCRVAAERLRQSVMSFGEAAS